MQNAVQMGNYFGEKLEALKSKFPVIQKVKGMALMRALALSIPGAAIVDKARSKGLLINCTQENILRVMPALTVTKKLIDRGLAILEGVFEEVK